MDTKIPFQPGLLLGRSVNMRKVKMGYMPTEILKENPVKVNLTTTQFSFINSFRDVCEILSIAPEYALKVAVRENMNETVAACLQGIEKDNSFSLIFRASFLQQKRYIPNDVAPFPSKLSAEEGDETNEKTNSTATTESLIADAAADTEPGGAGGSLLDDSTHWVKALEVGDELITIVTISTEDTESLQTFRLKLSECLGSYRGLLDTNRVETLLKVASKIDKKLTKKHYRDVKLDIKYCAFHDLNKYPADLAGMVKTIETFMDRCVGWTERYKYGGTYDAQSSIMSCKIGLDVEKPESIVQQVKDFLSGPVSPAVVYHSSGEGNGGSEDVDEDHESFVVLDDTGPPFFYYLRATLQSFEADPDLEIVDNSLSSLALNQYPESTKTIFENLYKLFIKCLKAIRLFQEFISSQRFWAEDRVEEGNKVLKSVQSVHMLVINTIEQLDLVHIPPQAELENLSATDPLESVKLFIETVTSRLSPGSDLDLLMIGKTGHGKSSTGNSILNQNRFVSSADGDSVTSRTHVGWAEIDGRVIKVVDTPGVCDTNLETDASSIDLAIKSISDAIANCPEGFHALLLIIRFGIRMTMEEKKAVGLLKCVLGEDIVKSHCVCVITHGDNFEAEMRGKKTTFEEWCRSQSGFLKELFEECGYRCVLFNNKATDPKVKTTQLIELVAKVDSLKGNGTRYTNALFDFAQRERKRIISEEQVPQASEDMMKDIQLILEYLNTMVHNTDEQEMYKEELSRLKERVDNLTNKFSEADSGQLGCLVDTVFALAGSIHAKMDEIADRPKSDSPDKETEGATASSPNSSEAQTKDDSQRIAEFEKHCGVLQDYYDKEVCPVSSMVTEKVSQGVKEEVSKEKQCFPGSSKVILSTGLSIAMKDLQVGDKVLVKDCHGKLSYDSVYMFGHRESQVINEFIVLETLINSVAVTSEHYVYCVKEGKEQCVAAKDVEVGDSLLVVTDDSLVIQPVQKISFSKMQGLFAPFTTSGTIVVDGALMSCYVNVLKNKTCHTLLWPVQHLYHLSPATLALINGSSKGQTVPVWAKAAMKLM